MNFAERQIEDRRRAALNEWRALGRRARDRQRFDNERIAHWMARFDAAKQQPPRPN